MEGTRPAVARPLRMLILAAAYLAAAVGTGTMCGLALVPAGAVLGTAPVRGDMTGRRPEARPLPRPPNPLPFPGKTHPKRPRPDECLPRWRVARPAYSSER